MKPNHPLRWLGPALVLLLGFSLAALFHLGRLPNYLIKGAFTFDFASLFFFAALLVTLIWVIGILSRQAQRRRISSARVMEQAAQSQERQRFLRRLDHELKNPLTTIRLGITNLKEDPGPGEEMNASLERISHQAQRLQDLVENLRRLAEMDETSLDRSGVDLAGVLEEAREQALSSPDRQNRNVTTSIQQVPWPLPTVWADHDLLVVAFRNLIENALKFSIPEGLVEIRASEDGHRVLVEINDNGRGIPPEDLPHIFDELYRGENARGLPGSGLGLALVRRIIELHNGSIEVQSRPQQGTMVRVHLPASPV